MAKDANRGIKQTMSKKKREGAEGKPVVEKKKKGFLQKLGFGGKDESKHEGLIRNSDLFRAMKPRKQYAFFSDFYKIDGMYATILTVLHNEGADDKLGYFWGIDLIPRNLDPSVVVRRLEHVARESESWVEQHQGRAESLLLTRQNDVERAGNASLTSRQKLSKEQEQMVEIADDLMNGSSYLRVAFRLIVKAPTLAKLDEATNKINRQYKDRFDTVFAEPYVGEQKRELSNTFAPIERKLGRNFMFTSREFAGNYSLVTRGIEDPDGEYIGQMEGDVNNSAVLMNLDNYESHVVIAGNRKAQTLSGWDFKGERASDVWGAKIGMSALLNNQRVVHLVLNRSRVEQIGIDLSDITAKVDMTQGDINPFEMFGDRNDSETIFPAHLDKMVLMVEQLQPMGADVARIKAALKKTLNDFYVDKRMWVRNAQENRDALRVVGIPHEQVPKLPEFLAYLDMEYHAQVNAANSDPAVMNAYGFLQGAFQDMLDSNGDLFNVTTSDIIDDAGTSGRVVYDFSSLLKRDRSVMMAQFVNALGFAVGNLKEGDVVFFHGVDQLVEEIKPYVRDIIDQLYDNGVRTGFIYQSVERMIEDKSFNRFDAADYTLLEGMTEPIMNLYEESLSQQIPSSLKVLLNHRESQRYYLRRGFDNIVFSSDIQMGFDE